jgi:hypothetical protein
MQESIALVRTPKLPNQPLRLFLARSEALCQGTTLQAAEKLAG